MTGTGRGNGTSTERSGESDAARLTSVTVGRNVARLRGAAGLPARALAEALVARGLRMSVSGIQDIEAGRRTVSVDQLTSLADALEVSPLALLMPYSVTGDAELVGVTGTRAVEGLTLWNWLRADYPLDYVPSGAADEEHAAQVFERRSTPPWAWRR